MAKEEKRTYKLDREFKTKVVNARIEEPLAKAYQSRYPSGISEVIEQIFLEHLELLRVDYGEEDYYVFQQWACSLINLKDDFIKRALIEDYEIEKFKLEFYEDEYLYEFTNFVEDHLIFKFLNEKSKKILDQWNRQIKPTGKEFYIASSPVLPPINADTFIECMKNIEIPEWMSNPTREDLKDEYITRIDLIKKNIIKSNVAELDDEFFNEPVVGGQIIQCFTRKYRNPQLDYQDIFKYILLSDDAFGEHNRRILVNSNICYFGYDIYYRPSDFQIKQIFETTYSVHQLADVLSLNEERIIEILNILGIKERNEDSMINKREKDKLLEYLMNGKGEK